MSPTDDFDEAVEAYTRHRTATRAAIREAEKEHKRRTDAFIDAIMTLQRLRRKELEAVVEAEAWQTIMQYMRIVGEEER